MAASKRGKASNNPEQPDSEAEAEQPRAEAQALDQAQAEPEQQPEIVAEAEPPRAEAQELTSPPVELEQQPRRRRSLFAHLLDRLDWLEDWLRQHQGFTEQETQVIIRQHQDHQREMEDEEWHLQNFFLVEIHRKGGGESQQWKTVAFNGDQDSPHQWEGVPHAQLAAWVLNELGSGSESKPGSEPGPEPGSSELKPSSAKITILRAQIRQPSQPELTVETQESNLEFTAPIKGNDPFDVAIQFKIDGLSAADLPLSYELLYDAKDQTTKQKIPLRDEKLPPTKLVELRDVYTATIEGLRLQPGTYQLRLVITDHDHVMGGISPLLQVT